jgi:hypothetical protein
VWTHRSCSRSPRYSGSFTVSASTTVQAIAVASGYNPSGVESGAYSIGAAPTINFSNGFASVTGLALNGSAVNSDDSRLQLTTGGELQAGSAFWKTAVNIQSFTSNFTFQLSGSAPLADGITFTIQSDSPTAIGPPGGGLGYGPSYPNITTGGIPHSIAIKFDVFNNAGEGTDSTGLYLNGASPTVPAVDLSKTGIILSNGDTITANLTYAERPRERRCLRRSIRDRYSGYHRVRNRLRRLYRRDRVAHREPENTHLDVHFAAETVGHSVPSRDLGSCEFRPDLPDL